jgi:predicted dehydrogenase
VLVEKPLIAERDEDLQELQTLAASAGVTCWTAYNHRFEPNLMRLQRLLAAGELGDIYHVRFFYGNGTAADVRQSAWRDAGMGVIPDLGSHLLDLTDYLLGLRPNHLECWSGSRFENRAFDHVVLGAKTRPALQYEMTLLSWRNTFAVDVIAEKGSAHVQCLCKWGPSTLTVRRRVLPSGRPTEDSYVVTCPDPTWEAEYRAFLQMCARPQTSIEKDRWINATFQQLQRQGKETAWAA